MKITSFLFLVILLSSCTKNKIDYLKSHRYDLNDASFSFPDENAKVIGFGSYHGSAKAEEVELALLTSLIKDKHLTYYIIEADYSTGHFFNEYLKTGNEKLLKEQVKAYGVMVPQDRTIETFEKWRTLKKINDTLAASNKLQVIGIDIISDYKNTALHILDLIDSTAITSTPYENLKKLVKLDTARFYAGGDSYVKQVFKELVIDITENNEIYNSAVINQEDFNHIIANLKITFNEERGKREPTLFDNYVKLGKRLDFDKNLQFVRIGFFHLEKAREGKEGYPPFFTRLVESKIYSREEIISIIGYFTESRVNWEEVYEDGLYKTFITEGGIGIGDYEKEYFRGINNLKRAKISDKTLFKLNGVGTLYNNGEPDLIDIIMTDDPSNTETVKGMSTLAFIDYAVLISNSRASTPIFEME